MKIPRSRAILFVGPGTVHEASIAFVSSFPIGSISFIAGRVVNREQISTFYLNALLRFFDSLFPFFLFLPLSSSIFFSFHFGVQEK